VLLGETSQLQFPSKMAKFCITSQKQSVNIVTVFSIHSVERFSSVIDFVLRGCREGMAQGIRECISNLKACLAVELVVS
jgi:hypothetical protein